MRCIPCAISSDNAKVLSSRARIERLENYAPLCFDLTVLARISHLARG